MIPRSCIMLPVTQVISAKIGGIVKRKRRVKGKKAYIPTVCVNT